VDSHAVITVRGAVQGVGYRWFVNQHAELLGLKGFVRNNFDGSVFTEVEGDKSLIEALIKELKVGPRSAHVSNLTVEWSEPKYLFLNFMIR
jgi:acylphosphatase